jgi:hypothetical protein
MSSHAQHEFEVFWGELENLVRVYQSQRTGKLTLECRGGTSRSAEDCCTVFLQGAPYTPCTVSRQQLRSYFSHKYNEVLSAKEAKHLQRPIQFLSRSLLDILDTTGHGEISVVFERHRKQKTCFVGIVQISYRWLLPPCS